MGSKHRVLAAVALPVFSTGCGDGLGGQYLGDLVSRIECSAGGQAEYTKAVHIVVLDEGDDVRISGLSNCNNVRALPAAGGERAHMKAQHCASLPLPDHESVEIYLQGGNVAMTEQGLRVEWRERHDVYDAEDKKRNECLLQGAGSLDRRDR